MSTVSYTQAVPIYIPTKDSRFSTHPCQHLVSHFIGISPLTDHKVTPHFIFILLQISIFKPLFVYMFFCLVCAVTLHICILGINSLPGRWSANIFFPFHALLFVLLFLCSAEVLYFRVVLLVHFCLSQ